MAVTYGFYNSQNGDRKYDAEQMSSMFDGIIEDGVYQHIGDAFHVTASGKDRRVTVGTGRAWFNHTWTLSDAPLYFDLSYDSQLWTCYSIILEVNKTTRVNSIYATMAGEKSSKQQFYIPALSEGQHLLATITVPPSLGEEPKITQGMVKNHVGTSRCPYVTAPLEKMDISNLIAQWEKQWDEKLASWNSQFSNKLTSWNGQFDKFYNDWKTQGNAKYEECEALFNGLSASARNEYSSFTENLESWKTENENSFNAWFAALQAILDEDTAAQLAGQILSLTEQVAAKLNNNVSSYGEAAALPAECNVILFERDGTNPKTMTAKKMANEFFSQIGLVEKNSFFALLDNLLTPEMHRRIFRGANLGMTVTEEQKRAISTGNFNGLFVGDYWEIDGIAWRIVDLDYFYNNSGASTPSKYEVGEHHAVIMPDCPIGFVTCNTSKLAYPMSYVSTRFSDDEMKAIEDSIPETFKSANILSNMKDKLELSAYGITGSDELSVGVNYGTNASSGITISAPSVNMIYGGQGGSGLPDDITVHAISKVAFPVQFALFAIAPKFIGAKATILTPNYDDPQGDASPREVNFYVLRDILMNKLTSNCKCACWRGVSADGCLRTVGDGNGSVEHAPIRPVFSITGLASA